MPISAIEASFLGTVLEGLLYGVYVVLFAIFISLQRREGVSFFRPITLITTAIFILCTAYFAVDVPQQFMTVIPNDTFSRITSWTLNLTGSVIYSLVDLLCQLVMIYRCWAIWDRQWLIIILPTLLALAAFGGEISLVVMLGLMRPGSHRSFPQLVPTGNASFSLSLAVNASVTALIVLKIWLVSRRIRKTLPETLAPFHTAMAMAIESGLLMVVVQLVWVVTFALQNDAFYLVSGPITMIYGITPTVLGIRVRIGASYEDPKGRRRSSLHFASSTKATHDLNPTMSTLVAERGAETMLEKGNKERGLSDSISEKRSR